MGGRALIELEDASRQFRLGPTTVRALEHVALSIAPGEFVAITGPSGSGKSTLLHVLGFLDRLTAGRYRFDGRDVTEETDAGLVRLRRFRVGFVFQQFYLLPRMSALDNVEVALVYQRLPRVERRRRSREALERVGLGGRLRHQPNELSGGEQQRVAIARALVKDAAFILTDEPTGNLDTRAGAEIIELLADLNREGKTVVVVTHDEDIARRLPRRIRLRDGRVVEDAR